MAGEMFVAKETFYAVIDGEQTMVKKSRDLVRAGHPLLEKYPGMFTPARVRFDVEQATAAPGEKRDTVRTDGLINAWPMHVGGGTYETPDGKRHRGREAAVAHMFETAES